MLGRYQMKRGRSAEELPEGVRQDTRKHTKHPLRPETNEVARYLADPTDESWARFAEAYRHTLERRWAQSAEAFDALAELARTRDLWLGCSCPTAKNPDVRRCHTWLALELMQEAYPDLEVRFPEVEEG